MSAPANKVLPLMRKRKPAWTPPVGGTWMDALNAGADPDKFNAWKDIYRARLSADRRLPGNAFRVADVILRATNHEMGCFKLTLARIAAEAGVGYRAAQRSVKLLVSLGYLLRVVHDKRVENTYYPFLAASRTTGRGDTGDVPLPLRSTSHSDNLRLSGPTAVGLGSEFDFEDENQEGRKKRSAEAERQREPPSSRDPLLLREAYSDDDVDYLRDELDQTVWGVETVAALVQRARTPGAHQYDGIGGAKLGQMVRDGVLGRVGQYVFMADHIVELTCSTPRCADCAESNVAAFTMGSVKSRASVRGSRIDQSA
jgi:hypothetical protein